MGNSSSLIKKLIKHLRQKYKSVVDTKYGSKTWIYFLFFHDNIFRDFWKLHILHFQKSVLEKQQPADKFIQRSSGYGT